MENIYIGLTLLAFITFFAMLEGLLLSVTLLAIAAIKFGKKICCQTKLPLWVRKKKVPSKQVRPAMVEFELQVTDLT